MQDSAGKLLKKNVITKNVITNLIKDIMNFFKGKERSIIFEFGFLMSLVIMIIILAMGAYIQMAMRTLNDNVLLQSENIRSSLSATIINSIEKDLMSDNYKNIDSKISPITSNRLIAYLIVLDRSNGNIIYSSVPPASFNIHAGSVEPEFKNNTNYAHVTCIKIKRGNKTLYLGFYPDSIFTDSFNILLTQTPYLIVGFILLGLLLAYFLSRQIVALLRPMIKVTNAFAEGDLSNRMDETKYSEINELVISYNSMADTLQRLYSTLESQVHDRTRKLEVAYDELKSTQAMMVHSEKMKSLGELVAGIMHEINNPINFIYGNLSHLSNYSKDLVEIISSYEQFETELSQAHSKEVNDLKKEIDYDFLKADLPDLIKSCKEGAERAKNIILNLKDFSRMEEVALSSVDIPKEIETTLNILHNKMKHKVELHKEYDPDVPKIEGYGGQLNQVFMNILDNAAFAVKETGDIWIRLKKVDKNVIIEFEDNGVGMEPSVVEKIFNPFFTTKPVGQGTGLGMSISYKVIRNHHGDIRVESQVGKGTKFTITLPIQFVKETTINEVNEELSEELEVIE